MTHICVNKLIIVGSDNGLSPDRRQAIISTNAGLLSIGPLRTYFSENLIKIQQFSLKKIHMKMSLEKWRPSCLGLNVLKTTRELSFLISSSRNSNDMAKSTCAHMHARTHSHLGCMYPMCVCVCTCLRNYNITH